MDSQLTAIVASLQAAEERLRSLLSTLPCETWSRRPGGTHWSPAQCVAHLNLTSRAVLPILRTGLSEAGRARRHAPTRYRRDPIGWLLWMATAPSCRLRSRTVPALMPLDEQPLAGLVADFSALQTDLIACVDLAAGLPIDGVTVTSPINARLRCNLYAALTLVPRHQHRHLLQAELAAGLAGETASARTVEARA